MVLLVPPSLGNQLYPDHKTGGLSDPRTPVIRGSCHLGTRDDRDDDKGSTPTPVPLRPIGCGPSTGGRYDDRGVTVVCTDGPKPEFRFRCDRTSGKYRTFIPVTPVLLVVDPLVTEE